jgi:hypothetical protein
MTSPCWGQRSSYVSHGSPITLAVDARRMHFFDPATGEVLGNDRAAPSEPPAC